MMIVRVAMAAAQAAHEMREFNVEDAKQLPGLGRIQVIVSISAAGADNISRIESKFGSGKTHMVLERDGEIIQPVSKTQLGSDYVMGPQVWNVVQVGNVTLANNYGAFDSGSVMYEFIFNPPDELRLGQWNFVLVGKGDKSIRPNSTSPNSVSTEHRVLPSPAVISPASALRLRGRRLGP